MKVRGRRPTSHPITKADTMTGSTHPLNPVGRPGEGTRKRPLNDDTHIHTRYRDLDTSAGITRLARALRAAPTSTHGNEPRPATQ